MPEMWMSSKVKVFASGIHGRGIIAVSEVLPSERILIWGGPCYTNKAGALTALEQGHLIMQWDDDLFSYDLEIANDECFLINHSCDPNAWMADAHTICARRKILAGEEVTSDYALWESDESYISSWRCSCKSPLCRGRVTGVDWKEIALQERYHRHFSPHLNKRIRHSAVINHFPHS